MLSKAAPTSQIGDAIALSTGSASSAGAGDLLGLVSKVPIPNGQITPFEQLLLDAGDESLIAEGSTNVDASIIATMRNLTPAEIAAPNPK